MNWKLARIVTLACVGVILTLGWLFAVRGIYTTITFSMSRNQCKSSVPRTSIEGCSAILASKRAGDADRAFAHFQRGLAYERNGDLDLAIQDDTLVLQWDPRMSMAYNNRGFAYQRKGDLDRAIADYDHAIQLEPESPIAWFNRGESYSQKANYLHAIDDFSQVVTLDPKNPVAWNNRCYYRAIAGQLEEALADCNKSLQLKPGVPETLDSRAFTYLKMKKYDLAIADWDGAIGKGSANALYFYGRGLAKRATHNAAGASADIEAARRIDSKIAERFRKLGVS